MYCLKLKRIYLEPSKDDGYRILCDRLWPRGISKEKANLELWFKDIAPSNELRKKFHSDKLEKEFSEGYFAELESNPDVCEEFLSICRNLLKKDNVTLVFGSSNLKCNNATVLFSWLSKRI